MELPNRKTKGIKQKNDGDKIEGNLKINLADRTDVGTGIKGAAESEEGFGFLT